MNVASLELCTKLYKLSEWGDEIDTKQYVWAVEYEYVENRKWGRPELRPRVYFGASIVIADDAADWTHIPAYDLGYLLRKLPANIHIQQRSERARWWVVWHSVPEVHEVNEGRSITEIKPDHLQASADTPEDAVCLVAIELFKQGILEAKDAHSHHSE